MPPDFHVSSIPVLSIFTLTPTTTPPQLRNAKESKTHQARREFYWKIWIYFQQIKHSKVIAFPFLASIWLRESKNAQRNILSSYKSDWSLRSHSSYYCCLHSVICLPLSFLTIMTETRNETRQRIGKKLMMILLIHRASRKSGVSKRYWSFERAVEGCVLYKHFSQCKGGKILCQCQGTKYIACGMM